MFSKKQSGCTSRRAKFFRQGRLLRFESMEGRLVLSASGFAGNECAPELNDGGLDQIVPSQSFSPGDTIEFQFKAADVVSDDGVGATAASDIKFILDPDLGTRLNGATPEGATLTLNDQGTADVEDDRWQFSWTPDSQLTGTFRLFLIATDDGGTGNVPLSDVYSFNITIDDRTSVDLNGDNDDGIDFGPVDFAEAGDSDPVSIVDTDLSIPFASGNMVTSATVKLSNPQADGLETLGIDAGGSLTVDSSTPGELVITVAGGGQADKAVFENALRTLTYNNTSDDPEQTRTITITVNDGRGDSLPATTGVNIELANDRPDLLSGDALPDATVGAAYVIPLVATDPDSSDLLTFRLIDAPDGATIHPLQTGGSDITEQISVDTSGNYLAEIRWTPTAAQGDLDGPVEFLVVVTDSGGLADSKIYSVAVGNHPPVANDDPTVGDDPFAVGEDAGPTVVGNILDNDIDIDGDTLTVNSVSVDGTQFAVGVEFTHPVSQAKITVSASGEVTFNPDGAYEPLSEGGSNSHTFQYTAIDDHNNVSSSANVRITVNGANDAPTQTDVVPEFRIPEDAEPTALDLATLLTAVADIDFGDTHSVVAAPADPTEGGSFSLVAGVLSYDPNGEVQVAADSEVTIDFQVTIRDIVGAEVVIDAQIIVEGVNDAPLAVDDTDYTTDEDSSLEITEVAEGILENDSDDSAEAFTVGEVNGVAYPAVSTITIQDNNGREGNLTVQLDGTFTFDPNGNFDDLAVGESSELTFTYRALDGEVAGLLSNEATVTITVTGVNDVPVAEPASAVAVEGGDPVVGDFSGTDADNGEAASLTYQITSQPSEGAVVNNDDGTFQFDPQDDFQDLAEGVTRDVLFSYTATDAQSAVSDAALATITVTGKNDAPAIDLSDDTGVASALPTGSFDSGDVVRMTIDLSSADQNVNSINLLDIPAFTTDIDGDGIGFSLADSDNGGTPFRNANRPILDGSNRLVWTPTTEDIGENYIIRVQVQDQPASGALSVSFDLVVNVISGNPSVVSVSDIDVSLDASEIFILFNEAMGASALNVANYSLETVDGNQPVGTPISILTATAGVDNRVVLALNDAGLDSIATGVGQVTKLKLTLDTLIADVDGNLIEGTLEFEIDLFAGGQ